MKYKKLIKLISCGALLALCSCSHTNVESEWDCPKQQGFGCMRIEKADQRATSLSAHNSIEDQSHISPQDVTEYELWLAEYDHSSKGLSSIRSLRYRQ